MVGDMNEERDFDHNLSPLHTRNIEIARKRGWFYDRGDEIYRTNKGIPIADRYGNPLRIDSGNTSSLKSLLR